MFYDIKCNYLFLAVQWLATTRLCECAFHQGEYLAIFWSVHNEPPLFDHPYAVRQQRRATHCWFVKWPGCIYELNASSDTCHFHPSSSTPQQESGSTQACYSPCHWVSMWANWYLSFRVYKANRAEIFRVSALCSNKALGKRQIKSVIHQGKNT